MPSVCGQVEALSGVSKLEGIFQILNPRLPPASPGVSDPRVAYQESGFTSS